jgi:hypothetical protein
VGVWKEGRSHFFVCEVCDREVVVEERKGASWDEIRLIPTRLREEGWLLNKRRGEAWEAQCPDCAQYSGYKMGGPEAFE